MPAWEVVPDARVTHLQYDNRINLASWQRRIFDIWIENKSPWSLSIAFCEWRADRELPLCSIFITSAPSSLKLKGQPATKHVCQTSWHASLNLSNAHKTRKYCSKNQRWYLHSYFVAGDTFGAFLCFLGVVLIGALPWLTERGTCASPLAKSARATSVPSTRHILTARGWPGVFSPWIQNNNNNNNNKQQQQIKGIWQIKASSWEVRLVSVVELLFVAFIPAAIQPHFFYQEGDRISGFGVKSFH